MSIISPKMFPSELVFTKEHAVYMGLQASYKHFIIINDPLTFKEYFTFVKSCCIMGCSSSVCRDLASAPQDGQLKSRKEHSAGITDWSMGMWRCEAPNPNCFTHLTMWHRARSAISPYGKQQA